MGQKRKINPTEINLDRIIDMVESFYGVRICGKSRRRDVSFAKQVAAYLMMVFTRYTMHDIAVKVWGLRDHSRVSYSNKNVRDICRFNEQVRKDIIELESRFE